MANCETDGHLWGTAATCIMCGKPKDMLIQDEFDEFCIACFGDISRQQYIDLRHTFFGGASALYFLVMRKLSPESEPTEGDLEIMRGIHREIHRFNEEVKKGAK